MTRWSLIIHKFTDTLLEMRNEKRMMLGLSPDVKIVMGQWTKDLKRKHGISSEDQKEMCHLEVVM